MEKGVNPVELLPLERLDFPFAVHDETERHRLNSARREFRLHFSPKYRREFKSHQTVKDPTSLLSIHKVHIYLARILHSLENSALGDFVEGDSLGVFILEPEGFEKVPGNGLSLAVLIGCKPNCLCLFGKFLEFADDFLFCRRDDILGLETVLHINAQLFVLQVTDVSFAGFYDIIFPKIVLNFPRFSRGLDNYKIRGHIFLFLYSYYI